jgi:hypothetical protein
LSLRNSIRRFGWIGSEVIPIAMDFADSVDCNGRASGIADWIYETLITMRRRHLPLQMPFPIKTIRAIAMIAFIHIEKTAGNTVTSILRRSFGPLHCDARIWRKQPTTKTKWFGKYDLECTRWIYWKLKSIAGHLVMPGSNLLEADPNVWFFAFLRDPIERCASHYQFQVQKMGVKTPFEEWIETPGFRNVQTQRLAGEVNVDQAIKVLDERVGFVGLVEEFDESLVMLRNACPLNGLDIRYSPTNVAENSQIKHRLLLNPKTRQLLEDANESDLSLYDYVKNDVFPQQKEEYGSDLIPDVRIFRSKNSPAIAVGRRFSGAMLRHAIYRPLVRFCSGSWWY